MNEFGSKLPRVCLFESRRADEMSSLVQRQGATAVSAPSMREVPIEDNPAAIQFIQQVLNHQFAAVVLLTGVGTEALFDVAKSQGLLDELLAALRNVTLIVRGPKPAAVLHRVQIPYALKAPEPNTWRELLVAMDQAAEDHPEVFNLCGKSVAVQEYGLPNPRLYQALEARGATVTAVPVYRWALPENTEPLADAIRRTVAAEIDLLLFTSANQIVNVLAVADQLSLLDDFRKACAGAFIASIGPTCSEALQDHDLPVHFEASPPKMGQLVRGSIELWRSTRKVAP